MPDAALPTASRPPWWRDRERRNRAAIIAFAALALASMLFVAFANYLFAGDRRVLVVTMAQDAEPGAREQLKQSCGDLPSVTVVPDRGNPDPRLQNRFTVRFAIAGATDRELSALQRCVNDVPGVRGFLVDQTGG